MRGFSRWPRRIGASRVAVSRRQAKLARLVDGHVADSSHVAAAAFFFGLGLVKRGRLERGRRRGSSGRRSATRFAALRAFCAAGGLGAAPVVGGRVIATGGRKVGGRLATLNKVGPAVIVAAMTKGGARAEGDSRAVVARLKRGNAGPRALRGVRVGARAAFGRPVVVFILAARRKQGLASVTARVGVTS